MRNAESRFADSTHCAGVAPEPDGWSFLEARPRRPPETGVVRPSSRALTGVAIAILGLLILALGASSASAALRHSVWTNEFGPDGTPPRADSKASRTSDSNRRTIGSSWESTATRTTSSASPSTPPEATPWSRASRSRRFDAVRRQRHRGRPADPGPPPDTSTPTTATPATSPDTSAGVEAGTFNIGGEICGLATDNAGNRLGRELRHHEGRRVRAGRRRIRHPVVLHRRHRQGLQAHGRSRQPGRLRNAVELRAALQIHSCQRIHGTQQIFGNGDLRMAVNGAKHVLYVTNNTETIYAYQHEHRPDSRRNHSPAGAIDGVAVDESNDTLYAFATERSA